MKRQHLDLLRSLQQTYIIKAPQSSQFSLPIVRKCLICTDRQNPATVKPCEGLRPTLTHTISTDCNLHSFCLANLSSPNLSTPRFVLSLTPPRLLFHLYPYLHCLCQLTSGPTRPCAPWLSGTAY